MTAAKKEALEDRR